MNRDFNFWDTFDRKNEQTHDFLHCRRVSGSWIHHRTEYLVQPWITSLPNRKDASRYTAVGIYVRCTTRTPSCSSTVYMLDLTDIILFICNIFIFTPRKTSSYSPNLIIFFFSFQFSPSMTLLTSFEINLFDSLFEN